MCDVEVCLICLRTGLKMYIFDRDNLLSSYEDIVAKKILNWDILPWHFCFECAAMLHKFDRFKQKCIKGYDLLQNLCLEYGAVTNDVINTLDIKTLNLTPINFVTTSEIIDLSDSEYDRKMKINFIINAKDIEISTENKRKALDNNVDKCNVVDETNKNTRNRSNTKNHNKTKKNLTSSQINNTVPEFNTVLMDIETDLVKDEVKNEEAEFIDEENDIFGITFDKDEADTSDEDEIYLSSIVQARKDDIKIEEPDCNSDKDETSKNDKPILKTILKKSDRKKTKKPKSQLKKYEDIKIYDKNEDKSEQIGDSIESHEITDDNLILMAINQLKRQKIEEIKNQKFVAGKRKHKKQNLDESMWKCYDLTEDEALSEFHAMSADPKYQAAEHKCEKCYQWFRTKEKITRHTILRHNEKLKFECLVCRYRIKSNCLRGKHLQLHYKRYECLKCGLRTRSLDSAMLHQDIHKGTLLKCKHCDEEFRHMSTYYTHLRTLRSDFVCNKCGMSFVSQLGLDQHKKQKHVGEPEVTSEHKWKDDPFDPPLKSYCEKCKINFETPQAYVDHIFQSAVHDVSDEKEFIHLLSEPKKRMLEWHRRTVVRRSPKKYRADYEHSKDKNILDKEKVKKFYNKPTQQPTDCHLCEQKFPSPAACFKHHKKEHSDVPYPTNERVICEHCGVSLAPGSLYVHNINKHSAVRYTCDTCGRSFRNKALLKRHALVHTGEKPYPCKVCDKRFTQRGSMMLHYRTFHLKQPYPKRNRRKYAPKDVDMEARASISSTSEHSVCPVIDKKTSQL